MSRLDQLKAFLTDSPNDPFVHYAIAQEYRKMDDLSTGTSNPFFKAPAKKSSKIFDPRNYKTEAGR
jgi:hypothetical protein